MICHFVFEPLFTQVNLLLNVLRNHFLKKEYIGSAGSAIRNP